MDGRINLGFIGNWVTIGVGAFIGITLVLLFSKFIASKSLPVISPVAAGVVSLWNMTVAI